MVFDLNVSKSNSKNCQYRNRLFTTNNPHAENKNNILLFICGRYWIRTNDPLRVEQSLFRR